MVTHPATTGLPDVLQLAYGAYVESGAEAVTWDS
jgi:hypothetical protein